MKKVFTADVAVLIIIKNKINSRNKKMMDNLIPIAIGSANLKMCQYANLKIKSNLKFDSVLKHWVGLI